MEIVITLPRPVAGARLRRLKARLAETVRRDAGRGPARIATNEAATGTTSDVDAYAPAVASAEQLVRKFLATIEERDLARAAALTAADFRMVFPGPRQFRELADMVAWLASRYRWVRKRLGRIQSCPAPNGTHSVYCSGTLFGAWPGGTPFTDIRFIDHFVIAEGKILEQHVWNDLAEARAHHPPASEAGG